MLSTLRTANVRIGISQDPISISGDDHQVRVSVQATDQPARMVKRVLAALLWFYTGWYFAAILADFMGVSPLLGPIIGAASAALFAGDPRGLIWKAHTGAGSIKVRAAAPPASQLDPTA